MKKQMIPMDKLKSISIEMEGTQYCYKGKVIINGIELNKGVGTIDLHLVANKKPQVTILERLGLFHQKLMNLGGCQIKTGKMFPTNYYRSLQRKNSFHFITC